MSLLAGLMLALLANAMASTGWGSVAGADSRIVFALAGDSILNRRLSTFRAPGVEDLFGVLRGADVAFTNFEALIHDFQFPASQQSGGTYLGSPRYVLDELAWAGFDLLALANNHVNDYGVEGLRSTLAALSKTEFVYAGVGENLALARKPGYLDTPKGRVALISASSTFPQPAIAGAQRKDFPGRPGLNPLRHVVTYTVPQSTYDTISTLRGPFGDNNTLIFGGAEYIVGDEIRINTRADRNDIEEMQASVRDAAQQADWVLVSIHSHESANPTDHTVPAEFMIEFAHAMIDAGADMIVGHGPHILRGIEVYKGKPIFYSLGNFIFENELVQLQPADIYEFHGLDPESLPSDLYSKRSRNDTIYFPGSLQFWQSAIAEVVYHDNRTLLEVRLHPVSMGFGQRRSKRGRPYPSPPDEAERILRDLDEMCASFGTAIVYDDGVGILTWN